MRSLLTLLLLCCLSVTLGVAQQRTTTRKPGTTQRKPSTTTTRRPATTTTQPAATTQTPAVDATSSMPASLIFPSTEPDVEPMDPVKKQQMYDELHGVKSQTTDPQGKGRGTKDNRRADREQKAEERASRRTSSAGAEAGSFIGVRVGGNYTTFLESLPVKTTIYGFHAGVVGLFGRGAVAFQPEINFVQDYSKLEFGGISLNETSSAILVPLLAKFQFGQQGNTRLFVNVGPYGAYAINNNTQSVIEYGGALGLGVGIPMNSGAKLTFEVRGYYGLGSTAQGSEFGNVPGKPIQGQLSVGYLFPLGSR